MLQGIIFDADGTLLDSMPVWNRTTQNFLRGLHIEPTQELRAILAPMTLAQSSQYLREHFALPLSEHEMHERFMSDFSREYAQNVREKPGIPDFLQGLQALGIPMVIATSGERRPLESALKRIGIDHYFQSIFICSEHSTHKQERLIFDLAAAELGGDPKSIWIMEDSLYALKTAYLAGYRCCAIGDDSNLKNREEMKNLSHFFIEDIKDYDSFLSLAAKEV